MEKVAILMEEYRALYGLVGFRLSVLEQRTLVAWGLVVGFWVGTVDIDQSGMWAVLVSLPLLALLLLSTTIAHAQSCEDALRRLEEIERAVNAASNSVLLEFQSRHPSRGKATGGRIGRSAVSMIAGALLALLASCWVASRKLVGYAPEAMVAYAGLLLATCVCGCHALYKHRRYRYTKTVLPT